MKLSINASRFRRLLIAMQTLLQKQRQLFPENGKPDRGCRLTHVEKDVRNYTRTNYSQRTIERDMRLLAAFSICGRGNDGEYEAGRVQSTCSRVTPDALSPMPALGRLKIKFGHYPFLQSHFFDRPQRRETRLCLDSAYTATSGCESSDSA